MDCPRRRDEIGSDVELPSLCCRACALPFLLCPRAPEVHALAAEPSPGPHSPSPSSPRDPRNACRLPCPRLCVPFLLPRIVRLAMASFFNSLASIVRAYILPPKLDAEQIEEATKLAQVQWLDESSADLPRPRSTRTASQSSRNVRFAAPLLLTRQRIVPTACGRRACCNVSWARSARCADALISRADAQILELDQRQDGYALQAALAKMQKRDRVTVPQVFVRGKLCVPPILFER